MRLARYTLPSLLQGHPPSQSSGTLMSLQEGIAVLCARMGLQQALSRLALGRRTDVPAEPPQCPEPNIHSWRAVCGTSPEYSFPASAHTLSKPSARVSFPAAQPHPLLHLPGEGERVSRGEAGMFRRDIRVSDAERGRVPCRSKEHTASTRPTKPNHYIQPKK